MHSKRPKFSKFSRGAYLSTLYNLARLARLVHSPPTPKILPPTHIPIENPATSDLILLCTQEPLEECVHRENKKKTNKQTNKQGKSGIFTV